jgi:glutamate synthase (ferredoxin)
MLPANPFLDPSYHRDACGVGLVADRRGRASHRMLRLAIGCLVHLDHRGAVSADGTGDGAGLLSQLPYRIFERELRTRRLPVPPPGRLGVVSAFLPRHRAEDGRRLLERSLGRERLAVLGWRRVPVAVSALGGAARETMPRIEQAMVAAPPDWDPEAFERRLFLARKRTEREALEEGLEGLSIPSASCRTIVYKGLFTARLIADFYGDLRDPAFETSFAIFHQRYSTNTFPSWHLAQPFRMLAHNGEINTIRSNRAWMATREVDLRSPVWGDRTQDLKPLLQPDLSDSGSLDNVLELLVRSGRSLPHAKEMLIPAAWENVVDLDPGLQAFYEYHAFLSEPWDGPAAIAASDGLTLLAAVDRNGLRPARWALTPEVVLVASEAGVMPEEEARAEATGQLGPGEVLAVEVATGAVRFSEKVKEDLCRLRPYGQWIRTQTMYVQQPFDPLQDDRFDAERLSRVFGYTAEERRLVLREMAEGREPLGSMGNDTPLAVLSETPRRLSHFFHQLFAQVTNPAMDPIRERLVMSLRTYLGRRGSLLEETTQQAHLMELASPVLSDAELDGIIGADDPVFRAAWLLATFPAAEGEAGLRQALAQLCDEAEAAVRGGFSILVLSDREVDADWAPIPMLLTVGAVHHRLIRAGLRLAASIVVVSGEPRDAHDLACLIAFGASAVNPYLAIEHTRAIGASGEVALNSVVAQENLRTALENGLLKIISKMGICTISAYRGSQLFEVIGLDDEVCELAFAFAARRVGGTGLGRIARDVLARHARHDAQDEEPGGFYRYRRDGIHHVTGPGVVLALQRAVRSGLPADWQAYVEAVEARPPSLIRDLLGFRAQDPVPLGEVEPLETITRRFVTAGMSHGALSREAHEALAEAMAHLGGLSNCGEGGEDPRRYQTSRNSPIKQVASGRFGVTPGYLVSAEELQIKIAQGSKPGEGGQLPGHKVSEEIARLRHTEPGVTLISPPPHHDIYSIEDLAQLIYDLKAFKPSARVSVKLVSCPGVGTVAVGVAKAGADAIVVCGAEGGTGASPLVSIKHAGSPWELGLAEAHQVLVANVLRDRVELETDGGLRTGRDVVVAALLGAERFAFGTLPLLALGCKMVRQCHQNTCPVGIATQRAELRTRFSGAADHVVQLFLLLAEEVRRHLAFLGARSLSQLIGRADLLEPIGHPVGQGLGPLLVRAEGRRRHPGFRPVARGALADVLLEESRPALQTGRPVSLSYPVSNVDRAVGTHLAGEVAAISGDRGLPEGTVAIRLAGTAGQSLGAFLTPGISVRLEGVANDYVGKGMGGGRIVVAPRPLASGRVPQAAGNAVLYGATGGRLFVAGAAGQRFAVRNSGAVAVAEGCSDHGCEYMTGGTVVLLGPVGRNFGAGMTGGVVYVWDPEGLFHRHLADTAPAVHRPTEAEALEIRALLEEHSRETGSPTAHLILDSFEEQAARFWVLRTGGRAPAEEGLVRESLAVPAP